MADELANDGVVGNGLIINRFNDTQHTFQFGCHRVLCCIWLDPFQ